MRVTIELRTGPQHSAFVTARDVQKNIDALARVISGCRQVSDDVLLLDTVSILEAIKKSIAQGKEPT